MKMVLKILVTCFVLNLTTSYANSTSTLDLKKFKYDLDKYAEIASVKTDLHFCLLGAMKESISGDKIIDEIILSTCDETLDKARELNISEQEILQMAEKIKEEQKKKNKYFLN